MARWRVHDNLPGTRHFCPLLVRSATLQAAADLDLPALLAELTSEFGEELIYRSAVWMTLRESRASFAIEGEAEQMDRVQRFADVIARRSGLGDVPLQHTELVEIQRDILGPRHTLQQLGVRQSPVFVGETVRFHEVVQPGLRQRAGPYLEAADAGGARARQPAGAAHHLCGRGDLEHAVQRR